MKGEATISPQMIVDLLNAEAPLHMQLVKADGTVLWEDGPLPPLTVGNSVCFRIDDGKRVGE